jgi:hypothetical protein
LSEPSGKLVDGDESMRTVLEAVIATIRVEPEARWKVGNRPKGEGDQEP